MKKEVGELDANTEKEVLDIHAGEAVVIKKSNGETRTGRITKLCTHEGTERKEVAEAIAGDIVMVAGLPDIYIGETICANADQEPLPAIKIDEPTISLNLLVNDSSFAGREGKFVTIRQIRDRLERELEVNVGLRVDFSAMDSFKVYGRGELHISILLEQMRREGFELQVSQPQVIIKEEKGVKLEPYEELIIDVPTECSGVVIEKINKRKGLMTNMKEEHGITRVVYEIPTRGLLGFRGQFTVDTKGEGILSSRFIEFRPFAGEIKKRDAGSMVSMASGKALGFSLWNLQERGVLYIGPATEVYEGMVVGENAKAEDVLVNICKTKELTNFRTKNFGIQEQLSPPRLMSLEDALDYIGEDELVEATPKNIRIRKAMLSENERRKIRKSH